MKPAPHTPISFIKAGATATFSEHCVSQLASVGYVPEDFGPYDYVKQRCKNAREKCNNYRDAVARGKKPAPEDTPTRHERFLAGCQAGHLQQNATMQRDRGNPCTNVVDGHQDGKYPCMPHEGSADMAGTEHNWVSHQEVKDTNNIQREPSSRSDNAIHDGRTPAPQNTYPRNQMENDADRRIKNLPRLQTPTPAPTASEKPGSGGSPGSAPGSPGQVSQASGVEGKGRGADNESWNQEITGETAADCINNFRKAGEAAMRAHCKDPATIERNRTIANGGPGNSDAQGAALRQQREKEFQQAQANRQKAEADHRSAVGSVGGTASSLQAAQKAQPPDPALIAERQAAYDQARQAFEASKQNVQRAENAETAASRNWSTMRNAHCLQKQGEAIAAGSGRLDGRSPAAGDWPVPDANSPVNLLGPQWYN